MLAAEEYLHFWRFPKLNGRERRSTSLVVGELVDSSITGKNEEYALSTRLCPFFLLKQQRCRLVTEPSRQQMTLVGYKSQWQMCLGLVCLSASGESG